MEAIFATLTDDQRVATLNSVYQKGISTPVENLAFSADKLVYLKPFIGRLLNADSTTDLNSRIMLRQVIDELLADIVDEVALSVSRRSNKKVEKVAADYGLSSLMNVDADSAYSLRQVA